MDIGLDKSNILTFDYKDDEKPILNELNKQIDTSSVAGDLSTHPTVIITDRITWDKLEETISNLVSARYYVANPKKEFKEIFYRGCPIGFIEGGGIILRVENEK